MHTNNGKMTRLPNNVHKIVTFCTSVTELMTLSSYNTAMQPSQLTYDGTEVMTPCRRHRLHMTAPRWWCHADVTAHMWRHRDDDAMQASQLAYDGTEVMTPCSRHSSHMTALRCWRYAAVTAHIWRQRGEDAMQPSQLTYDRRHHPEVMTSCITVYTWVVNVCSAGRNNHAI